MNRLKNLGGQLAWFDRLTRAIVGIVLILWAGLGGASSWTVVTAAALGGILVFESILNYCPLAKIWPWNR
jgi:hypothetical protein